MDNLLRYCLTPNNAVSPLFAILFGIRRDSGITTYVNSSPASRTIKKSLKALCFQGFFLCGDRQNKGGASQGCARLSLLARQTGSYQSFLSLIAFRRKPPIIVTGMDTERETGSIDAPRIPPKIVQTMAIRIIATPPQIPISNIYKRGCYSLRFSFKMKVIG